MWIFFSVSQKKIQRHTITLSEHRCFKEVSLHGNQTWFEEEMLILHLLLFSPPHVHLSYPHTLILNLFFDLWLIKFFNKRNNSILPRQARNIFNFAFEIREILRLSTGGRCTVVWTSCLFSLTPWKVLNVKKQMQLLPVMDCGEWVVYEMLMWETWPLLPAEPQTSWVTLSFPLSFLQFLHL